MRFRALDSWRGVCALIVALFHYPIDGAIAELPLIRHGYLFVDFFFVLSGFVISTAYGERVATGPEVVTFLVRRFGRLWPLHLAMLAVFIGAAVMRGEVGSDERHSVQAIITNLLMVHGLGVHSDLTWNSPSWSISVEAFLYLLFSFVAGAPWRFVVYICLMLVGMFVLAFWAPEGMGSTFDFGVFRGLFGFFLGCLISYVPRRAFGTVAEFAVLGAAILFVSLGHATLAAPFVFGVVVYVFAQSDGLASRLLNLRPAVAIGEWSYSIYMVHAAVVAAIWALSGPLQLTEAKETLHGWPPGLPELFAVAYLGAIIIASAITYNLIEQPGRRAFNRLSARRTEAPAT